MQKSCHLQETSTSQTLISARAPLKMKHIDLGTKVEQRKEKVWNGWEVQK